MTRRRFPSEAVVAREIERALKTFGGVESWELTPEGGLRITPASIVKVENANRIGDRDLTERFDELAEARRRRDERAAKGSRH